MAKTSFSQYSGLTYFPNDNSFLTSVENIENLSIGTHIGLCFTPNEYYNGYRTVYFNRFGVNFGILKCGIVFMGGIKINLDASHNIIISPDYTMKLQLFKLLTGNKNIFDFTFSYNISNNPSWGFGIAIPRRY